MNKHYSMLLGFLLALSVSAQIDHHPKNNGTTNGRNINGSSSEALYANPALLGVERSPKGSLLLPPFTDVGVGYWSDKLAMRPYRGWWSGEPATYADIVGKMLTESFRTEGSNDPDENARLASERLKGGVSIYAGAGMSLLAFAWKHIGFDLSTHVDFQETLPEGLMQMVFPNGTKGLVEGASLDFTDLRLENIWATDLTVHLGLPLQIPALHDLLGLQYGAGGVGIKYVMGHGYFRGYTDNGKIDYRRDGLSVDADVTFQQAGLGLQGPWDFKSPFQDGFKMPVAGHGIGVEAGGILYNDHASLAVNFENLGVIFWVNDVKQVDYHLNKDGLNIYDIIKGIDNSNTDKVDKDGDGNTNDDPDDQILTIFDRNRGEEFPTSADTLSDANGFATALPLALNIGYSYSWDFERTPTQGLRFLAEYITSSANYKQQFTRGPGRSFIPRLSLGTEFGLVRSYLPVRVGLVLGGPEKVASAFGAGFNFRYFSINAAYKAIGTPFWAPKRGLELMAGLNFNWGMVIDSDKDGIIDRDDKCPFKPEDKDGFEDEDGCPDDDNDQDGILDPQDNCPVVAEDLDGFEDEDGCPDYDNDKDNVPDSLDKCINEPEDRDNFKDEDGCPEYDNDGDGVPDSLDKCPVLPEDLDGFEDEDGCPEYDNDKDGMPDSVDNCIFEPEVYNGYKDDDGCPDTLQKPTKKEEKALNTKLQAIHFKSGSAELTSNSFTSLNYVVRFLKQYPHLRYEIQGHTDSRGSDEYNLLLSAARAGTVRDYLVHMGLSEGSVISIGYGEQVPLASNETAAGRAQNRRVQFRIIDTNDDYEMLKKQQEIFKARILEAKIKGVGKKF